MRTLEHAEDVVRLIERLRRVQPASRPRWGKMSAHQMVCHLADAFRMSLGERRVRDFGPALCPQGVRTLIGWTVLYAPLPWPRGIRTSPELDPSLQGTRPAEFAADVAEVEALMHRLMRREAPVWPRHPVFGRLSREGWLRWGYLHMDYHLRQFGA